MLFLKKIWPRSVLLRKTDVATAVRDPADHPASAPTQDNKDTTSSENKVLNLSKFFDSATFSDITLKFSQHEIKAHKVILSGQSAWFAKALTGSFQEASQPAIELHDDDPEALKALIEYCYGIDPLVDSIPPKTAHKPIGIVEIYAVADKYDVPELKKRCLATFENLVRQQWAQLWESGDLSSLVETVCLSSAPRDPIRSITVALVLEHMDELRATDANEAKLRAILEENPDFAADLLLLKAAQPVSAPQNAKTEPVDPVSSDPIKTPLHWAAQRGEAARCTDLLASGTHVDVRDENDETPLHFATWYGQLETARLLVEAGADMNATSRSYNASPLHWAINQNHAEIVSYLQGRGAT